MKKDYTALSKDILRLVGGRENIESVYHCVTRLRFKLKDESVADTEAIKNLDGVVTVAKSGGQYQVVIGNHVPDVYANFLEVSGIRTDTSTSDETKDDKMGLGAKFIDIISGVFTPILGVLAATGMIKGFAALFLALHWVTPESGTYQLLNIAGDGLFTFLPVFLGYTAMKKFGGTPFIGIAIAVALVHPNLSTLSTGDPLYTLFNGTVFQSNIHITFLGIPVILMSYASSVIPIIVSAYFAAKLEKRLKHIIPDVIKTFIVPFFTIIIMVPLTFIVIGPIATWAGSLLGAVTVWIYKLSPILTGILLGGLWQIFVMFGLHWGLVPIAINNLSTLKYDPILATVIFVCFAQIGAVLAVMLKTKDKNLKSLSVPAFISGVFGVTEPAIYGVTLPLKKPFIMSCIGGAVGGGIIGAFSSKIWMIGGLGIFAIPTYIQPGSKLDLSFWGAIISLVVSFIVGFLLTYFFGFKDKDTENKAETTLPLDEAEKKSLVLMSPLKGDVIPLSNIEDGAFSSEAMGKGVAIEPMEGKVISPVNGVVTALFQTKHAICITSDEGLEILIHIGMDTVKLEGQYFTAYVKQGDVVKIGDLLVEFDINKIKEAGYEVITPIVITNSEKFLEIKTTPKRTINQHEALLEIYA
ncbi:beta-glucoside-specific PTS transporter subunit IIABC [Anoxybacillus ayderensis]|uniref:beta-glucoside-specific PTS transporter subunit IIABC n=1 Tax=Anoxybacillus ayderensis TaxID=265546 RepID=UPI002E1D0CFB|nr:beta-glucoside-specific PTS transporter subunit IIABC [Anoxybacillus ayderensis]MED0686412.1 beta-glucoside-specific PTS transporter subunit IIABC [Anoxybacillus ayderensis]